MAGIWPKAPIQLYSSPIQAKFNCESGPNMARILFEYGFNRIARGWKVSLDLVASLLLLKPGSAFRSVRFEIFRFEMVCVLIFCGRNLSNYFYCLREPMAARSVCHTSIVAKSSSMLPPAVANSS